MADDASREGSDSEKSRETAAGGDQGSIPPWDSTMHRSAADGSDGDVDGGHGDDDDERSSGNVAGEFRPSENIEPGDPSLENSLFVVFGAYVAILGLTRLFIDLQGFDARDVLVLTGGTLLISIVLFGFLGLLTPDT